MAKSYEVGDVVMLKSGGPEMTVKKTGDFGDSEVLCQWFGGRKLEQGYFPPASLVPATPEDDA